MQVIAFFLNPIKYCAFNHMKKNRLKVGLALSGGGALGASHAGVIKALTESGIAFHHVTGVSAGAIIGALYCGGKTPDEILDIFEINSLFDIFNFRNIAGGLVGTDYFQKLIHDNIEDDEIAKLKIKFSIGATNLNSGHFEVFEKGKVSQIAAASAAVPLLFKPVKIEEDQYVDGGLINNLLVEPLTETCDFIIGVNAHYHERMDNIQGVSQVGKRCFEIIAWNSLRQHANQCDFLMEVKETSKYRLFDFKHTDEVFECGYKEMKAQIHKIMNLIEKSETR